MDLVIVRELTGGVYFGDRQEAAATGGDRSALDTLPYHEREIARVVRLAFDLAGTRRGVVTQVDKANVLATSRLWRRVTDEIAAEYPDITLNHQLVDSCAMLLIRRPADFDVIVTENLFGDILSDEAAVLAGSSACSPASLGSRRTAHGLRPVRANPRLGTGHRGQGHRRTRWHDPLGGDAAAYLAGPRAAADAVETAVTSALAAGWRTADLADPLDQTDGKSSSALPRSRRRSSTRCEPAPAPALAPGRAEVTA